jgi:hypothetical protein
MHWVQLGVIQGAGCIGLGRRWRVSIDSIAESRVDSRARLSPERMGSHGQKVRSTEKMAMVVFRHDCAVLFGLHRWRPR